MLPYVFSQRLPHACGAPVCALKVLSRSNCWAPKWSSQIVHRLCDTSPTCIFIMKAMFLYLETTFFFVCFGWLCGLIFVFNSSLRDKKRRKDPTLLSACSVSPEVWDVNSLVSLYGFPKALNMWWYLIGCSMSSVPWYNSRYDHEIRKSICALNHREGEQLSRKEQPTVQASDKWSERRRLWDYFPSFKQSSI